MSLKYIKVDQDLDKSRLSPKVVRLTLKGHAQLEAFLVPTVLTFGPRLDGDDTFARVLQTFKLGILFGLFSFSQEELLKSSKRDRY